MGRSNSNINIQRKKQQPYFWNKQVLIPLQRTYIEGKKINKYVPTDFAQISLCIVEQKTPDLIPKDK